MVYKLFVLERKPTTQYAYYEPYNKLGDERRNTAAITEYNDLPQEEKDKDIIIANFIMSSIRV